MDDACERAHGTAVALLIGSGARAALIRGAPGAGKSDLALRCIALAGNALISEPARLVADDQVVISLRDGRLDVTSPAPTRGLIEVRGIGIVEVGSVERATLALVVDLVSRSEVSRMPDPPPRVAIRGMELPLLRLHAFDASAPLKLLLALRHPRVLEAGNSTTLDDSAA